MDERIAKMARKKKGKIMSKGTKEKIRLTIMKKGLHEILKEYRKNHPPWNKGLTAKTDGRVRKYVEKWQKWIKEYYKTAKVWNKGLTKETDSRVAKLAKKKVDKKRSEETRKKISKTLHEKWKNENFVKTMLKKMYKKPNRLESFFSYILCEEGLPYKYVGDGAISINGKCPDFININGQKKVIELFGDFYHKAEEENDRKNFFSRYGYKTLIIWEHEIKSDLIGVLSKVKEFT
ncbi:MAG: endonuclease domain-containing protein [Euryarchaeota archaeon]|nr:endonuclease domain-containing protein [Euryarchaeota archaeon]